MNRTAGKTYRPGVYSTYSVRSGGQAKGERYAFTCGNAKIKAGVNLQAGGLVQITSLTQLQTYFEKDGGGETFYQACYLLLQNGVPGVYAVPITIDGTAANLAGYQAAFLALGEVKRTGVLLCQSGEEAVLLEMKRMVERCSVAQREKVGVAAVSRETAINLAVKLNCERILLCAQKAATREMGEVKTAIATAAELAGKIAAMPSNAKLSGLLLPNLTAIEAVSEAELEAYLAGGVTVLEEGEGGGVECVRALTTRTSTAGVPDRTFSSLNAVMMIDEIIQAVRTRLQNMLRGASVNTAFTLDSISSQVAVVLGEKQQEGFLVRFEPPVVRQDDSDPQVCLVEMEFHIAAVMSQIYLTAQIEL